MEEGRSEAEEEGLWRRRVKEGRMDCGGGGGGGRVQRRRAEGCAHYFIM